MLMEIVPTCRYDRKQFFVLRRSRPINDTVVREFETKEVRPQGGTWEGSKYDRGFYEAEDTILTHTVVTYGHPYMCLWLNQQVEALLESAEKVVIRSFTPLKRKSGGLIRGGAPCGPFEKPLRNRCALRAVMWPS